MTNFTKRSADSLPLKRGGRGDLFFIKYHKFPNVTHRRSGFTLIELLVAMVIIALLLSIVAPRYFHSVNKAEDAVLKEDLTLMRDALDKFHADTGKYPDTLEDLVSKKYLRKIPVDPITQSNTSWIVIPPANTEKGSVFDLKSGAIGNARDGSAYADW